MLNGEVNMKLKFWLAMVLALFASKIVHADSDSLEFTTIGSFSNMRFTEEHQYGSALQLWREGTDLLGLFLYSEGLIGDTPTGLLENTRYDSETGMISFTAKLTTGQHFCKVHNDVPSHDLFSFQGELSDSSVSGVLMRSDSLHPENPPVAEKVVLKRMDGEEANPTVYHSRADWEAACKEILKFRGPRW
jgi:hypothetical protein